MANENKVTGAAADAVRAQIRKLEMAEKRQSATLESTRRELEALRAIVK